MVLRIIASGLSPGGYFSGRGAAVPPPRKRRSMRAGSRSFPGSAAGSVHQLAYTVDQLPLMTELRGESDGDDEHASLLP